MAQNLLTSPELLKAGAFRKKNPEFAAAVRELELAHRYADHMLAEGRLTQKEADHFEAHLYGKFIEALPVDEFHELMKNGGMDHLQSLAGYEGDYDAGDIEDMRKAIEARIKADALDNAWMEGRIDNKYYAEQSRDIERYHDEEMNNRLADGDHDDAAAEYFVTRNDVPDHGNELISYFKGKYGDGDAPRADMPRNSDAPAGYVERDHVIDMPYSSSNNPNRGAPDRDGFFDYDAPEEGGE